MKNTYRVFDYYNNGVIANESFWYKGKKNGYSIRRDSTGMILGIEFYKDNRLIQSFKKADNGFSNH